jgi:oligoribonuclease NrnB/cAMP/cGMP phosphodiesterase (DHH superfamily)
MGKRGWGGPSIREGSHPPPYMDIATDLRDCHELLDEIERILKNNKPYATKVSLIRHHMSWRPKRNEC